MSTQQPLTKQTLSGFKWSTASMLLQGLLQFAIFTTLAHLLGPREFGIVGLATIFTNFIERVGLLGVGQALIQRERLSAAHERCGFVLCLIFGAALFALFFFVAPFIAAFFDEPRLTNVLRVIALTFLIQSVAEVPLCLLQRELKFKKLLVVTNLAYLIGNGVIGISMALLGYGYWSLVIAVIVSRLGRLIFALRARPVAVSLDFNRQDAFDLLKIGVGFSLGRFTNYCALVGDNFVTGKVLGATALGLYTRAYQLMTVPATYFGQILEKVLFAALSQRQSEPRKVGKYFLYGVELCSLVSVSAAVMLQLASREIVIVLFGDHWLEAVPAIEILAFGVFFRACYKNSDTVIRAMGAVYSLALRQGIYAALVIGGTYYGSRFGIEGVAYAVLFAVFLNYAFLSVVAARLVNIDVSKFVMAHAPAVWVGVFQLATVYESLSLLRASEVHPFISLVLTSISLGLVTLLSLYFIPQSIAPKVCTWMSKNLELEKFGTAGRIGNQFLVRVGRG